MIPCRCDRCCPENPAPTYTEAHKVTCFANTILDLPTLEARRATLRVVGEQHGEACLQRIKDEMRRLWNLKGADAGSGPAAAVTQRTEQECKA